MSLLRGTRVGWVAGLGLVFAVMACAGDDGAGEGGDGGPDADPPSGVWLYMDGGIQATTCGEADVYVDPNTAFQLTNNGDGTFTVDQGSTAEPFDCTISGSSFNCPVRLSEDIPVEGFDATLHYEVAITGSFSSDTAMSGEQLWTYACEGAACSLAPTVLGTELPCEYTVAFTATAP